MWTALVVFYLGGQVVLSLALLLLARRGEPLPEGSSLGLLLLAFMGGVVAWALWALMG